MKVFSVFIDLLWEIIDFVRRFTMRKLGIPVSNFARVNLILQNVIFKLTSGDVRTPLRISIRRADLRDS